MNQDDLNNSFKYSVEFDYKYVTEYIFDSPLNKKFENQISVIEEILNISVRKEEDIFFYLLNKLQNRYSNICSEINWENEILNACKNSHFKTVQKIIELIIKYKANEKHDLTESFKHAAVSGSTNICHYLDDCSLKINYGQLSKSGNELHSIKLELFIFIIEKLSSDLKNSFFDNYIYNSIRYNNKELVEFILKQRSDYENCLIEATKYCDIDMVNIILKYNCNSSLLNKVSHDGTPLIIACEKNKIFIAKRLLSFDHIDLSLTNSNNQTALQVAMNNINAEIVISIINYYGDNILSYIQEVQYLIIKQIQYLSQIYLYNKDQKESIGLILDRIIDIKNIDINYIHNNCSFLFHACENNEIKLCERLLKCDNIDVNITLSNGITPIISALNSYNYDIVELLIKYPKTDLYVKNKYGTNAITIIIRSEKPKLIKILAHKEIPDALCKYGYMHDKGIIIPTNKKSN